MRHRKCNEEAGAASHALEAHCGQSQAVARLAASHSTQVYPDRLSHYHHVPGSALARIWSQDWMGTCPRPWWGPPRGEDSEVFQGLNPAVKHTYYRSHLDLAIVFWCTTWWKSKIKTETYCLTKVFAVTFTLLSSSPGFMPVKNSSNQ